MRRYVSTARRKDGRAASTWKNRDAPMSSVVAGDRVEARHVLQQDAAALQIQNAILAPGLQLPVDAFASGADEYAELLLRDVDLGAEIFGQCTQPPRQSDRQRLQH